MYRCMYCVYVYLRVGRAKNCIRAQVQPGHHQSGTGRRSTGTAGLELSSGAPARESDTAGGYPYMYHSADGGDESFTAVPSRGTTARAPLGPSRLASTAADLTTYPTERPASGANRAVSGRNRSLVSESLI